MHKIGVWLEFYGEVSGLEPNPSIWICAKSIALWRLAQVVCHTFRVRDESLFASSFPLKGNASLVLPTMGFDLQICPCLRRCGGMGQKNIYSGLCKNHSRSWRSHWTTFLLSTSSLEFVISVCLKDYIYIVFIYYLVDQFDLQFSLWTWCLVSLVFVQLKTTITAQTWIEICIFLLCLYMADYLDT